MNELYLNFIKGCGADVPILDFQIRQILLADVPNFVKNGQSVTKILQFFIFLKMEAVAMSLANRISMQYLFH